uniref:Uncharacterized protein n=1 Tax=Candidatus Kentrum sp. FW TaxID=2126338 RepID=A0A450TND4_9GAMM|nr:MAG: hypothetical protein BECKFW1821C_GA0114237_101829 [Candidatus Kentron sp. FW]
MGISKGISKGVSKVYFLVPTRRRGNWRWRAGAKVRGGRGFRAGKPVFPETTFPDRSSGRTVGWGEPARANPNMGVSKGVSKVYFLRFWSRNATKGVPYGGWQIFTRSHADAWERGTLH